MEHSPGQDATTQTPATERPVTDETAVKLAALDAEVIDPRIAPR